MPKSLLKKAISSTINQLLRNKKVHAFFEGISLKVNLLRCRNPAY